MRFTVIQTLRDTGGAPSTSDIAGTLGAAESRVVVALRSLHNQHRLVLVPGTDRVMMAHPFSGIATDFVVAGDAIVHFVVSARRFWEDIGFTGSTMTAFRLEGEVQSWLAATGHAFGALISPQLLYELG